jgi:uncharacterized protein
VTWLIKTFAVVCGVYLLILAAMYFAQTWLIFPTFMISDDRPALPPGAQRLAIDTPDGLRLHGVHLPPARGKGCDKTVVLGFGGNGWHAEGMALDLRQHFPDCDIAVFNYRGYKPSTGQPSAAGILADSLLIHDHVRETVGALRVITVGYSLGSGPAAYVARERSAAGVILVTAFDALEAVAEQRYPWLPVRWLIRHHMPSVEFLRGLTVPVAVIGAEHDEVVPPDRTAALRQGITNPVLYRTIAGAHHNDIFQQPAFAQAMTEARTAILAAIDAKSASDASRESGQSVR